MLNLLGCNKENFIKLLELMNYKTEKEGKRGEENEIYFRYMPKKTNKQKKIFKKNKRSDNPFSILSNVNYNQSR